MLVSFCLIAGAPHAGFYLLVASLAFSSMNAFKLGRWILTDRPTRAAFSCPVLTYLQSVVWLSPEYRSASG